MRKYGVLAITIIALIIFNLLATSLTLLASSGETIDIYVTGTHNYDYAFEMLDAINKERKANNLNELEMDMGLLRSAMLRAIETSLHFEDDHKRPDGSEYGSVNEKVSGENVTAGVNLTVSNAMDNFMGSPTHRKNILTNSYKSVGIGHVEINGIDYWVQLFTPSMSDKMEQIPTGTEKKTYRISLLKEYLTFGIIGQEDGEDDPLTLKMGETGSKGIYVYNTWTNTPVENYNARWSSSNKGVATVDKNGIVTAVNSGTATITANIDDKTASFSVYVPYDQRAKVSYFDTTTSINIENNTGNITSWDRASKDPVTTILDNKHNLNFIYTDTNSVYIQRLDENMKTKDTLKIQKRYPVYGETIVDSKGNYYIAWGQNDASSESTGKITFAISKYDNTGKYISSYEKTDSPKPEEPPATGETTEQEETRKEEPTKTIFANGTCNMDINSKGVIAYNYAKETKSGVQCNSSGYIDSNTMQEKEDYKVYPYTSHAWATDVIALNTGDFVFMQQGDSTKRAYDVSLITQNSEKIYTEYNRQMFHFREGLAKQSGYYYTFSNYGSVEDLKTGVGLIASSEKTLSLAPAGSTENESRNVFIQILKRDYLTSHTDEKLSANSYLTVGERKATGTQKTSSGEEKYFLAKDTVDYGVKWLTNYSGDYTVKNVKTVEVDNDRIAIFYTVTKLGGSISETDDVYYMIVNNEGDVVQSPILLERGMLPGYSKPVYYAGYIYFTNSNGTNSIRTYKIELEKTQDRTLITVEDKEKIVNNMDKFNINATVNNGAVLQYETTNSSVLTIASDGTVTPKKVGEAEVIISAKDLPRVEEVRVKVIIDNKVRSISLDNTEINMEKGSSGSYIQATVLPEGIASGIVWSSSNEDVAVVSTTSNNNLVKIEPKSSGTCTITAYPKEYPSLKATCKVTVITRVSELRLIDTQVKIESGETYNLKYTLLPNDATNKKIIWTSTDENVATVDSNGMVTGINDGNATIIARSDDDHTLYSVCEIIVDTDVKIKSISVSPSTINFTSLTTQKLDVKILPENASNKKLEYSSANTKVAEVSEDGVVKAVGSGSTKITIKTLDDTNIETSVSVNVNIKCTGIRTEKEKIEINGKNSVKVNAWAEPSEASITRLNYSIMDTNIATIDQTGYVKPKKNGNTTIIIKTTDGTNIIKELPLTVTGIDDGSGEQGGGDEGDKDDEDNPGDEETKELPFIDVKKGDWYYTAVEYTYNNGIISGATDTEFRPNAKITRGMIVTILWRMEGSPKVTGVKDFTDVTGQYYYDAVRWAAKYGVVNGYGDGRFGPNANITREQLATILCNYAKYKNQNVNLSTDTSQYVDWNKISGFARPSMDWAIATGVIRGKNNETKVDPQGTTTRGEAACMIYNYCTKIR